MGQQRKRNRIKNQLVTRSTEIKLLEDTLPKPRGLRRKSRRIRILSVRPRVVFTGSKTRPFPPAGPSVESTVSCSIAVRTEQSSTPGWQSSGVSTLATEHPVTASDPANLSGPSATKDSFILLTQLYRLPNCDYAV